jgi:catechol 2,3-dioxygenase-like lactoylglutathione lyase family enzyme
MNAHAMSIPVEAPTLQLHGVHHTARPTWKLAETVRFYRDLLGLPLVHAISAKGWGPDNHADFLHFFFDSGNHSTIAFFYYLGTDRPQWLEPREHYQQRATHTAWRVRDEQELLQWRQRIEAVGIPLRYQIRHEVIESIYFNDPNDYPIEITWQLRPFDPRDGSDAQRTLEAAIALEAAQDASERLVSIEQVWRAKAEALGDPGASKRRASIYVLDVPEFSALAEAARGKRGYTVTPSQDGYVRIDGDPDISFRRKELGFKHALWYGALTGGLLGRIERFDMETLIIAAEERA